MKFVIRDDDVNYFTTPADIDRWYADIFAQGIPVSFAAIPFVTPGSDVYTGTYPSPEREYPIGENTALVAYLAQQPLAAILLHGCNHVTCNGVFEYQKTAGLIEDTRRGKEYLEKVFERVVSVFVPPHDQISNHGIDALEKNNLNLIRSKGSKNIILRWSTIPVIIAMLWHRMRFMIRGRHHMPAYPFVLSAGAHQEAYSLRIESSIEDLLYGLHSSAARGGDMVVVMHIHDMSVEKKEKLQLLINASRAVHASFVSAEKLFYDR